MTASGKVFRVRQAVAIGPVGSAFAPELGVGQGEAGDQAGRETGIEEVGFLDRGKGLVAASSPGQGTGQAGRCLVDAVFHGAII